MSTPGRRLSKPQSHGDDSFGTWTRAKETEVYERLSREGRTGEFNAELDTNKALYGDDREAWIVTVQAFPPIPLDELPPIAHVEAPEKRKSKELPTQEDFEGKTCSHGVGVQWVAENLEVRADWRTAPASWAWSMLVWAQGAPRNKEQFWTTIYVKFFPSKSQIDNENRFRDTGENVVQTIEEIQKIRADMGLNGAAG